MSDAKLVFHARFPPGPTEADVAAAHDAAAVAVGFVLFDVKVQAHGTTRYYGSPGGTPLSFAYRLEPRCELLVIGPYRDEPRIYEPARVADMFTQICVALDAEVGRSDGGGYYGIVQDSEMASGLAFVDWYQYLGPRIVGRIGRERVLRAPVFSVVEHESGGIIMMLAAHPWAERFSRRRVADYFGFELPPVPARNPRTGEPITIRWD